MDGVSILDWEQSGAEIPLLAEDIKAALEGGSVSHVLVNMAACEGLRADSLEALTQALTVCQDRSCAIGLYRLSDELSLLVEVSGLASNLPPVLGTDEAAAINALRNGGTAAPELEFEIGAPEPELEFDMPEPAPESEGEMEFEIELTPTETANMDLPDVNAPTARFDPATIQDGLNAPSSAPATPDSQPDNELLMVYWADLASSGYAIGGDGGEKIMAAVASNPSTPSTQSLKSLDDDVIDIDLGDAAPAVVSTPGPRHGFVTEQMPVFSLDDDTSNWSAQPTGTVQVDFGAGQGQRLTTEPAAAFGAQGGDYAPASAPTQELNDADETVMIQPGALEAALMQAGLAAAPVTAEPEPLTEGSNETVMFQPGALDAALLAEVAKAAGPATTLPAPALEPVPETPAKFGNLPEAEAEVRRFIHDYALTTNLHLAVLDRFAKSKDKALGGTEVQKATGAQQDAVVAVIDQLVQGRLLRRTRSMRIRGGTGFLFSTSPRTQGTVVRLLRMWADPSGRTKVNAWLQG